MKLSGFGFVFLFTFVYADLGFSQGVPNDPNHLPQPIGGISTDKRIDGMTVTGKVMLEGFPANQEKPSIFIIVYHNGRLNQQQRVSDNGSYMLNNVPRQNSVLVVEIEKNEVAQHQIVRSPSSSLSQDFFVTWAQVKNSVGKAGVISAKDFYQRSDDHQKLFDKAHSAIKENKEVMIIRNYLTKLIRPSKKIKTIWLSIFSNESL
jgi:hypothetical protein